MEENREFIVNFGDSSFTEANPSPFCQDPIDKGGGISPKQCIDILLTPRTEGQREKVRLLLRDIFDTTY